MEILDYYGSLGDDENLVKHVARQNKLPFLSALNQLYDSIITVVMIGSKDASLFQLYFPRHSITSETTD